MVGNHEMEMNHEAMRQALEFYLKEKALNKEWAANMRVSKVEGGRDAYTTTFKVTLEEVIPSEAKQS